MRFAKPTRSVLASAAVAVLGAAALTGCSGKHQQIDTTDLFKVESTFGDEFKTRTKGPTEIDPKMLRPESLPDGVTFDPPDCHDFVTAARLPKGSRGTMSMLAADGEGNRFTAMVAKTEAPVPFDAETAARCAHVTFGLGKLTGYVDEADAPQIDGVTTTGSHRQIDIEVEDGQRSSEIYNFTAYLGDSMVLVTAGPLVVRGQPPAPVDVDRARQLLVDAVAAVRS